MVIQQKVTAFRAFAGQLAAQVVEQLCQEYEREVAQLFNDVSMYRNELTRCAELLGHQLGRERQLHEMLEKVANHQTDVASSAQYLAQQSPNAQQLHDLVEHVSGQYAGLMNSALQGVSQAHTVAAQHAESAKQLQEPMISAENEFTRICSLLQQPTIEERAPAPTVAVLPGSSAGKVRMSPALAAPPALQTGGRTPPMGAPAQLTPPASVRFPANVAGASGLPTSYAQAPGYGSGALSVASTQYRY